MKNYILKIKLLFAFASIFLIYIFLVSCNINSKKTNLTINETTTENLLKVENDNIAYKYYDVLNISPAKIIIPKNQTSAQSLSVLVNDGHGNLVVFDGGRVEDADYLCEIIKDNGGVVKTWFITHIHDDHIGALYKILSDKRIDIEIQELYYDFASFDWYYSKIGDDAGIYYLFENAIKEYNKSLIENNNKQLTILNYNKNRSLQFLTGIFYVTVINNHLELDSDPINNTSIVYVVNIGNTKMLILGDLGFEGGNIIFKDNFRNNDSDYRITYHTLDKSYYTESDIDMLVLSHHGQNGIDPELYKRFSPKVIVWPTSKDIYENIHGRYYTDDTKKALSEISTIKYEIKSYEETAVIR